MKSDTDKSAGYYASWPAIQARIEAQEEAARPRAQAAIAAHPDIDPTYLWCWAQAGESEEPPVHLYPRRGQR